MLDTGFLVRPQLIHSKSANLLRLAQSFLVLLGFATIWIAHHPPMVDVPQHAAQVALLNDLLRGKSAWSELVWINLWTPYLLAYALLLPLVQIFSIATAIKLLLSAAYVCFVAGCFLMRRKFGSDEGLDIYAAVGFFGFAYYWGFLTFLVAAPLVLVFVLLSIHAIEKPSVARASGVFFVGLVLLISHGLAFAFAFLIGAAVFCWGRMCARLPLWAAFPYVALIGFAPTLVWWSQSKQAAHAAQASFDAQYAWGLLEAPRRITYISLLPFSGDLGGGGPLVFSYAACFAILVLAPWIMGLCIDRSRPGRLIPLTITSLVLLFAPSSFGAGTAFVYERFGLFLFPAYAWAFKTLPVPDSSLATARRYSFGRLAIVAASAWVLGAHAVQSWNFGRETRGIDAIIDRMGEGQRALMLMFDPSSAGAAMNRVYLHYPAWYQAERKGFVDFNFAWLPPLAVRFRRELAPPVEPEFEWAPSSFDWARHRGADYKYFFVRGHLPDNIFAGAKCQPFPIWRGDRWTVLEQKPCG